MLIIILSYICMKRIVISFLCVILFSLPVELHALTGNKQTYMPTSGNLQARSNFAESRFGIFLHWGIYSMFGQGEWYMQNDDIHRDEYAKAANAFYPHDFNAKSWVAAIKDAGARYLCFTTRHHDGFSMWNTQQSPYNIMHTPYGRDIVKQIADECHRQGVGLHLYYSLIDWTRDDYPTGFTGLHTGKCPEKASWNSYFHFMKAQLTELLTQYGKVDCIWLDGWWDHERDSIPFNWQLKELYELIHQLQPACLIGNNHHQTPFEGEDIQMFERDVPGENKAGLSGQSISMLPLETCETMNGMWGYRVKDQNYKSTSELIRLLVRSSAKGANLLLNIGPQPDGNLPALSLDRLQGMGKWLRGKAGQSIYGTTAGWVQMGDSIVSTYRKDSRTLYIHLLSDSIASSVVLPIATSSIKHVKALETGQRIAFRKEKQAKNQTRLFLTNISVNAPADCILEIQMR